MPASRASRGSTAVAERFDDQALRQQVVSVARRMNGTGLNQGTSGNLSVRTEGGLLVTPSSLPYEQMEAGDLVALDLSGESLQGRQRLPSSEWRLHADVLASRPEAMAVLHCHPIHATALACHDRGIPAFHYMVAVAGGDDIRCAPYATFGTAELSAHAVKGLAQRKACLLARHGLVTLGEDLESALRVAVEVETLARMYLQALQLGEPPVLTVAQMQAVHEQFSGLAYGQVDQSPR